MDIEQITVWELIDEPGKEPAHSPAKQDTSAKGPKNLDALFRQYAEAHKDSIYGNYFKGDLDKFVKHECTSWHGCYCGEYSYEFKPKEITFSLKQTGETLTMNKKQFTEKLKAILKEV